MADDRVRERNQRGVITFFSTLKSIYSEINSSLEGGSWNIDAAKVVARLEDASCTISLMLDDIQLHSQTAGDNSSACLQDSLEGILRCNKELLTRMYKEEESGMGISADNNVHFACETIPTQESAAKIGRPSIYVDEEQIKFLRSLHFSWVKIANILGISVSTLRRRRSMIQMEQFTDISDDQLKREIQEVQKLTPNIGQKRLLGALRARGISVRRERVKCCLRELDPLGTALRWRAPIYRRKYSVPCPNALWHLDGTHQLIHYKMVVHCCVDGFSRLIVYVHCANNNRAETVLTLFEEGSTTYGLPSRIRIHHGLENTYVAHFMLENRGLNRGSVIAGSSVHNTRVERTHRDVYEGVLCFYNRLFDFMESTDLLDITNDLHMYALHFVYIPRINRSLQEFLSQWNHHPLSTEKNMSPAQLFTAGILSNLYSGNTALDQFLSPEYIQAYGVDPECVTVENEDYQVSVPEINFLLSDSQQSRLLGQCNPLEDDDCDGVQLYRNCAQILQEMIDEPLT